MSAEESGRAPARCAGVGGIVLCGGRSTRMGTPKALLPFGAETMLQRVVRLLDTVVSPLIVVAAPGQTLPDQPPSALVARDEREGRGPLEGLRAGLHALPSQVDRAYVTSCDVPLLVPGFVRRMIELAADADIAVMEIDGFTHPLSAVYCRSTIHHVEALLEQNRLRPAYLFETVRTRRVTRVEVEEADPRLLTLRNVNTPDDYREALELAGLAS
jgi:molybdopterin-guanine dinucleotide biosynthesis protein A